MRWFSVLCLGLLATANLTGCGNKGGDTPKQIDIPKTPQGTVEAVATALSDSKFEVIWQAMPESYQGKVKTLIGEVAEHTDEAVYNKSMGVVGKFVKLLSDKQDFILGTDLVKSGLAETKVTPEQAKEAISAIAGLLGDLQGDIKTKDDLENLNVEKYLAKIGARIKAIEPIASKLSGDNLGQKMADMKKIKVTVKDETTDTATLEVVTADGDKETIKMTRVEGKWIPNEATAMPKKLDEMIKKMHEGPEPTEAEKKQMLEGIGQAETFLDSMLKASNQAEFNAAVAPLEGMVPMLKMLMGGEKKMMPAQPMN